MKYFINGMLLLGAALCSLAGNMNPDKPNVLLIYYDDMGYSDVGAYDTNQVSYTPHLDAFAAEGMRFTAGHSADAVCTPSRYALMTGRYCWRTSLKTHVLGGYSSPLMAADRLTIGKMFQDLGYETAMVGKWHVGMQFYAPDGSAVSLGNDSDVLGTNTASTADDEIDFSLPLTRTPNANGFDYYFGTAASLDMPPYTWIENQTVLFKGGLVTNGTVVFSQARPAVNGDFLEGEPIGAVNNVRDGVYDPNFVCSDYLQVQAAKVAEILALRAADDEPFFIYVPVPAPHLPWAVQEAFSGTAPFAYGDYLAQTDHYTGQILDALADRGLAGNTVVLITSDNGPSKNAMPSSLSNGHDCNGPFRGQKLDNWEGGTRVPFMIRWPALIAPGATTTHFCWQGDFLATMAEFLNYDLTPDQAPDAESFLSVLKGEAMPAARRPATIQHAYNGQCAIVDQDGVWKLLDGTGGNGSNSYDSQNNPLTSAEAAGVIFGSPRQLFNLSTDPGEDHNLLSTTPTQAALDKEAQLYALLNEIRGNTTYGTDGDSNVPPIDTDGDGIPSYFERATEGLDRADPSDAAKDFDGDKLSNLLEYENESDLYDADTDGDRLEDGLEVLTYGSRPNRPHSDTDSLEDGDEVLIWGTDPIRADTDGDGVDDDDELEGFSNPRNAGSTAVTTNIVVALDPDVVQLAGYNGTVDDPDDEEGGDDWAGSGTLFVRSRATNRLEEKTRCFLRFDLSGIPQNIESARLRIHQIDRLNDSNTGDLQLARVTDFWDAAVGSYPLFDGTGVTNGFVLGNNGDFGLDVDASGFYSGTVGVPGTDAGFDVTAMVQAWCEGTAPNYGFRIAFDQTGNVGAAFSTEDDPLTIGTNEAPQLMVTALEVVSADADNDRLRDAYELEMFGGLSQSGTNDFDGDGVNNLIEQALGSDPTGSNSVPVYSIILTNETEVAFSYRRCNQAGLGIEVLVSNDLTNWNAYTEYYAETASAAEPGADYETVLLEPVDGTPDHLFYRISVHALDCGTATDSTNAPFSGVLALYDAQADTNGNFNTGSFESLDPDVTTTAARLVQGGSLNGGGQNKYVLTRAVFDASASGSPGFNFAGTALADQRAATGAGDWFAF
ncbi:sulfatase-like hydrolase/transferase, partial [Pontiella sp.]|uniref:sulfatase-like hydrolase/transferase n=1 Tax=Pontiella sp. TaxID=2837462 RepID=UPI0035638FBC